MSQLLVSLPSVGEYYSEKVSNPETLTLPFYLCAHHINL